MGKKSNNNIAIKQCFYGSSVDIVVTPHRTHHIRNYNRLYFIFLLVFLLATSGCGGLKPSRAIKTKMYNSKNLHKFPFSAEEYSFMRSMGITLYCILAYCRYFIYTQRWCSFFFFTSTCIFVGNICCPQWL